MDALLLAKLREAVLAPLPSKVSKQTVPSAAAALEKLLREPLCFALGADSQGQVKGVLKVVKGLMEDEPPAEELMKNASDFYKQCMARDLNFAAVRVENASQAKKMEASRRSPWCTAGKLWITR